MSDQTPARLAIIGTSLDPDSRSQLLGAYAFEVAQQLKFPAVLLDLRKLQLPFCGLAGSWSDEGVARLRSELKAAAYIVFASPIYNYDMNAAAKNVLELMGEEVFEGKTIGFLCAAGGRSSYMSVLPFANSLMLDFRCWIVPRFVYATGDDFQGNGTISAEIQKRIEMFIADLFSRAAARL